MKYLISLFIFALVANVASAQQNLTREQILAMSTDELSELPLEDLMAAVETLGVSSVDELFALIMNKNVSSASKTEESAFTSPLASTVITHDELRTYGVTTIEEAMRLIPGMIVQQKTNGVYDVQMRGLNNIPDNNMLLYTESSNTLLMVDGRQVHNYAIGCMSLENLPISIEDVERIEVVRGASTALYGQNAVNGVINIITRKPDANRGIVNGSFQMGSQSTYVGDIAIRRAFNDKVAAGITFNMQYRERPNDKFRTLCDSNYYLDMDDNYTDVNTMYCINDIVEAVAAGKLIPVGGNQELTLDQYNHLRNFTPNLAGTVAAVKAQRTAIAKAIASGMTQEEAEAYVAANTDANAVSMYSLYTTSPIEYQDANLVFPWPHLARKNIGLNGYVSLTPNPNVRVDLTGGYSQAFVNNTTLVECPYSFNTRTYKEGYANVDAHIHDLHLQANYAAGPADYSYGRPGLKVKSQRIFATAEYDINIGDRDTWGSLSIRPGVNYQHVYYEDEKPTFDYGNGVGATAFGDSTNVYGTYDLGVKTLSGFMNDDCKLTSIAPALRLDYKKGDFRAILAVRSDKTNIPDKWNTTAQAALSYKFNDHNFLRLVYGRGMRSANIVSAGARYLWLREGMGQPSSIQFDVNKDADIMNINNFEIGYRFQPNQKVLVDAEVFYSRSKDYGAMQASSSEMVFIGSGIVGLAGLLDGFKDREWAAINSGMSFGMSYAMQNYIKTRTYTKYDNMPFEVSQFGLGVNIDWIISPKLIAKVNANLQRTIIDNYYAYNQVEEIASQISTCASQMSPAFTDLVCAVLGRHNMSGGAEPEKYETTRSLADFMNVITQSSDASSLPANTFTKEQLASLRDLWFAGNDEATIDGTTYKNILALYYGMKYGIRIHESNYGSEVVMGNSEKIDYPLEDGHVHKATPTVYGMVGLIAKPIKQLNFAAYGNFIGKRAYQTMYGYDELDPRFTVNLKVGYKPSDEIEIFFNGNNLFNSQKQEFVYSDEVGGIYTVGVNFSF